ncbi:DUF6884 domain-containing protein [Mesorhizobium escarrei]|uniref:DUF6884 domain-containing protein n=1 Tax=Mesorhizobium escarrei TaxID=666018 RepID=UPI00345C572F
MPRQARQQLRQPAHMQTGCRFHWRSSSDLCVKSKLSHEAAARDLYTSPLFTGARGLAEGNRVRWYVLSALYGLVAPQAVVAPYLRKSITSPL